MEQFDGDVIIGSPEDAVLAVYRAATGSSSVAFLPPGFRFWGPDDGPETIFVRALAKQARDRTERIACGTPLVRYIETSLPNAKLGLDVDAALIFLLHTPAALTWWHRGQREVIRAKSPRLAKPRSTYYRRRHDRAFDGGNLLCRRKGYD